MLITAGNVHDLEGARNLLAMGYQPKRVLADRAYDARSLREDLAQRQIKAVIPPNPTRKHPHRYDKNAAIAQIGRSIPALLDELLRDPYLKQAPPKSTGREYYGRAYVEKLLALGRRHKAKPNDLIRAATIFTSLSIVDALNRFVLPKTKIHQLIISGGGARNPLILAQLAAALGARDRDAGRGFDIRARGPRLRPSGHQRPGRRVLPGHHHGQSAHAIQALAGDVYTSLGDGLIPVERHHLVGSWSARRGRTQRGPKECPPDTRYPLSPIPDIHLSRSEEQPR